MSLPKYFVTFCRPHFLLGHLKANIEILSQWNVFFLKTDDIIHVIIGLRLAGTVISQKTVTAIGTGVVKTNEPKIWKEFLRNFKESLELTKGWARNVLRNMNW